MRGSIRLAFAALLLGGSQLVAQTRPTDWFVAPGATQGDGSRERPFHDPWRAFEAAASGDTIHVAMGTYHGRYDRSAWVVDRPRITLLGGYDAEFRTRDPWTQPTVLALDPDYEGSNESNLLCGRDDHSGFVCDGMVLDGAGRLRYEAKAPYGMVGGYRMVGALASFASADVVIRNCVFVNSMTGGVELGGEGCRFENNLVVNHLRGPMLTLREPRDAKRPAVVLGNTFAFVYDESDPPMGKGGQAGTALLVKAAAQIERNAFVGCGNQAIALFGDAGRVAIDRNLFWLGMRTNVSLRDGTKEFQIGDANLAEMEDLGFRSCAGNRAADAGLAGLDAAWVDGVTTNIVRSYATPPREGIAALRARYHLGDVPAPTGDDFGPTAPRMAPAMAAALRIDGDAGARPVALPVQFQAPRAPAAAASYAPVAWEALLTDTALDGKRVELVVAVGNERNGFLVPGITADGYLGFDIHHPGGEHATDQIHVFAVRNGAVHRQWQNAAKSTNARDAEDWYILRGTARATSSSRQKMSIQVVELLPGKAPPVAAAARPTGRDWFVQAGAAGGDGSREKPFRDPFQALAKVATGDTIRVAAGDYFGKLRSAHWQVAGDYVSLLGGYDAEFKVRDPWAHPTRLVMSPEVDAGERGKHSGVFLESADVNPGLVVDGFVFDGASVNGYYDAAAGGGLDLRRSPVASMVQLRGAGMVVRNCVFANASGVAVNLAAASGTFENNVVINCSGNALTVAALGPGPWLVRDNTFACALDPTSRAGTGKSGGAGNLLQFSGRAEVHLERNVFAFADNCAVRITVPGHKVWCDDNAFAANLGCHISDASRSWLHDATWARRSADVDFASLQRNTVDAPAPALDPAWLDKVLPRLFQLGGNYSRDAWLRIAAAVHATVQPPPAPEPVEAAAEKPPAPPKEPSLDDMLAELNRAKGGDAKPDDGKPPEGPPYAPAYDWRKALELFQDAGQAHAGARRLLLTAGR